MESPLLIIRKNKKKNKNWRINNYLVSQCPREVAGVLVKQLKNYSPSAILIRNHSVIRNFNVTHTKARVWKKKAN